MKVVFVNRFFCPDEAATSRIVSSLAFGLAKMGWSVHVVTGRRFHNGNPLPSAADEIAGVTVHRIWSSSFALFAMPDERRREIGARGLMLASTRFDWDRIAARLASVYQWVSRPDCVRVF
jgi:hypothetical protein